MTISGTIANSERACGQMTSPVLFPEQLGVISPHSIPSIFLKTNKKKTSLNNLVVRTDAITSILEGLDNLTDCLLNLGIGTILRTFPILTHQILKITPESRYCEGSI